MKKSLLFIIVGVLVVIIGAVLVLLLTKINTAATQAATPTSIAAEKATKSSQAKAKKEETFYYSPGDAFVTNVSDSEVLLKASVVLEINDPKQKDKLATNVAVIRDLILSTLRNCSEAQIRSPKAQEDLSDAICKRLNERFEADYFIRAYFTDLVVQ